MCLDSWDRGASRSSRSHQCVIRANIQSMTKRCDLPLVTLVGILLFLVLFVVQVLMGTSLVLFLLAVVAVFGLLSSFGAGLAMMILRY
jgi:hypothetical protein